MFAKKVGGKKKRVKTSTRTDGRRSVTTVASPKDDDT